MVVRMKRPQTAPGWYVILAVIASGGGVLAVEIAGTRLFGPFYGSGLYLWSALIGVALLALSLGYALGGRWADRGPRLGRFCGLIGAAGLWIAAMPWIARPVLAAAEGLGLRGAVLASSLVLFFPPLALLGMTSPYAVRLRTASLGVVGRTAGGLYAISTLASVAAALAVGFFLIPAAGPRRLVFLIGMTLAGMAAIGAAIDRRTRIPAVAALAAVLAAAFAAAPVDRPDPEAGLLAIAHSPYAEIRVVEMDDLRLMLIDGSVHTEVDAATLDSRSPYVEVLELAGGFRREPGSMLLVGLGGGSLAKRFAGRGWSVDAVEIDPEVTRMARSHFGLEPAEARVFHMDGREYLKRREKVYDLVILDAFGSSSIPFHLVTLEAFGELRARLASEGVLAMNVIAIGWNDPLVRALAATLRLEFARVLVLPMAEPPDRLGNLIILASNGPLELAEEPPVPMDRFTGDYHRAHAWDNRFEVDPAGIRIITDDRNPVDLWADRINLATRKALHEYFGSREIGW
jgi:spermidine synthase